MAERSTLTELCQIGVESLVAPGTAVAATKKLQAMSVAVNPHVDTDEFQPRGYKFPTLVSPVKDWTEGSLEGRLTYDEFAYALGLAIGGLVVAPVGGGGAQRWTCTPSTSAADTPRTATVENGSSVRAHRAAGLVLPELSYTIDRDNGCEIGGSALGLRLEDGVTLSPGAVEAAVTPVLIGQVSVFMDTTVAGIGTTKLLRLADLEWMLSGHWNPVWVIDAAQASYAATVEADPTSELKLTLEANAEGMGPLAVLRAGQTRFVRVEAVGATIAGADTFRFRHDMAVKVKSPSDFGDKDGLVTEPWTFDVVHDPGWGKSQTFELINTLTAL